MDFGNIIKTIAPWIGTALGGPLGGLAVEAAGNALGLSKPTTDTLKQALAGITPEQALALKKADIEFQEHMQELGFQQVKDLAALEVEDRKDARAMQTQTRSMMPAVLSIIIVTGFLGMLTGMMLGWLEVSDKQALLLMLGALGAAFGGVVNFWFGTSHDSGRKTDTLAAMAQAKG